MNQENTAPRALYICYFGLLEPLVQTQVLPYLREVRKDGISFSLITFESNPEQKWTKESIEATRKTLADEGIEWTFLKYHSQPKVLSTLVDILCGSLAVWQSIRRKKVDIIHSRVHIPAVMAAIARKFTTGKRPKHIFDIRGFFPEEYTDAGLWKKNGLLYKGAKSVERWLLGEADGFVALTEKAREILFPESKNDGFDKLGRPVQVIPCCVDMSKFSIIDSATRIQYREMLGCGKKRVVVYVGSFGGWYLTDQLFDFFSTARDLDPETFVLILTQRNKQNVIENLQTRGVKDTDFLVESVSPAEVPAYLSAADIAVSFIKPCYSKLASSPTKIAEYLACGLPFISNGGIGDIDELIRAKKVGVLIDDFDHESYLKALKKMGILLTDASLAKRCRKTAEEEFDLSNIGGRKYRSLYQQLLSNDGN